MSLTASGLCGVAHLLKVPGVDLDCCHGMLHQVPACLLGCLSSCDPLSATCSDLSLWLAGCPCQCAGLAGRMQCRHDPAGAGFGEPAHAGGVRQRGAPHPPKGGRPQVYRACQVRCLLSYVCCCLIELWMCPGQIHKGCNTAQPGSLSLALKCMVCMAALQAKQLPA